MDHAEADRGLHDAKLRIGRYFGVGSRGAWRGLGVGRHTRMLAFYHPESSRGRTGEGRNLYMRHLMAFPILLALRGFVTLR
jgi:hypothetical protein